MVKMNHVARQERTREQIQDVVEPLVHVQLRELGIAVGAKDVPHTRRTIRALVHIAARIARTVGCDVTTFLAISHECFQAETPSSPRAQA